MGSKGGGSTTSNTSGSSSTSIPAWLDAASQQAVGDAQAMYGQSNLFAPYSGQTVASTTPATQQAYQEIQNLQGSTDAGYAQANNLYSGALGLMQGPQQTYESLLGQATPLTTDQLNANSSSLYGNYAQNVMNPAASALGAAYNNSAGLLGGYLQGGPLTAQQVGANTQQLMSPYTASVISPTMQLEQQALAQNLQQIGAGANQAGAFGGSRQGVQEGVAQAQSALGSEQYLGNLLNSQWNSALPTAYNIGQLGAQQGYNAASALGTQGYNSANLLSQMGQSGYGQAATQGQNMANTNLNLGTGAASGLLGIASQAQGLGTQEAQTASNYLQSQMSEAGLLSSEGTAQQQQQQADLNAAQNYYTQTQNMPVENLDLLLSAINSVPYGTNTSTTGTGSQSTTTGAASSAEGAIGTAASVAGTVALIV
jgi:hypothetical protein